MAAAVAEARTRGESWRATCARLGIGHAYYYELKNDPSGARLKARKDSYRKPCPLCGRPMDGSGGPNGSGPKHCADCAGLAAQAWTRDRVIAAIQDFAAQYGRPPGARDWNPGMAIEDYRDDIAERFYADDCWPAANTVQERFGSWNAGIQAAGFQPMASGHKYSDILTPEDDATIARRYEAGESSYEIAKSYPLTDKAIQGSLHRSGVQMRSQKEAARLRWARERGSSGMSFTPCVPVQGAAQEAAPSQSSEQAGTRALRPIEEPPSA